MKISYDARGLAEPNAKAPGNAVIEGEGSERKAVFDAADLTTRQINLELRRLVDDEEIADRLEREHAAEFAARAVSRSEYRSPGEYQAGIGA